MIDPLQRTTTYQYDALNRLISVTDAAKATTTYGYDNNGNRTSIKDQLGNVTTMVYDAKNRLISKTDPSGNMTKYQYDAKDELIATISPIGRVTSRTYDARGNLASVTDPSSGTVSYAYDNENHLISLTDQRGNTTHFTYDALYRQSGSTDPVGNSSEIAYDANGNVVQKIDRLGRTTTITYDALNRVQTINFPDASVSYTYDSAGRTTQVSDSESGSLSRTYDPANRVLSETQAAGTVQYTYNIAGQKATMTAGNRPVVNYGYDSAGRLSTITQGPEVFTYSYDALSRVSGLARPNGVPTTYQYDVSGRLAQIQHGVNGAIENLGYSYTPDSQITSISSVNDAPLQATTGNASTPDPANRIAQFGTDSFTFDQEGQTLTDTNSNTNAGAQYTWDARGRLTQVTLANGQTVNYVYDALGRRISRSLNSVTTQFLYDGQDVVVDLNPDGSVTDYLNGPGIDQKLRQSGTTGPLYFLRDHLGSTVGLTNAAGGLLEREKYDSYGNSNAGAFTRYLYTGREFDSATDLYYYRARYYSPQMGRFISGDPLGFLGSGTNLYAYTQNNPIGRTDPSGYYSGSGVVGSIYLGPDGVWYNDAPPPSSDIPEGCSPTQWAQSPNACAGPQGSDEPDPYLRPPDPNPNKCDTGNQPPTDPEPPTPPPPPPKPGCNGWVVAQNAVNTGLSALSIVPGVNYVVEGGQVIIAFANNSNPGTAGLASFQIGLHAAGHALGNKLIPVVGQVIAAGETGIEAAELAESIQTCVSGE